VPLAKSKLASDQRDTQEEGAIMTSSSLDLALDLEKRLD